MPETADEIILKKLYEWRRLHPRGAIPAGGSSLLSGSPPLSLPAAAPESPMARFLRLPAP